MLFQSDHVRVTAEPGTATLWLDFPGDPVNALDLARLRALDAALDAVERHPAVAILVLRSAKPAGFCAGVRPAALASLTTAADAAGFAAAGQRVCDRLAALGATTVAYLDGPCLGAGLELALACDHRLVVSRTTTHLGFPAAPHGIGPCLGGTVRLRERVGPRRAAEVLRAGATLSGREARALGLVDDAFCERRGKIELRAFLDALERRGPRPRRPRASSGFAAERREFARSLDTPAARAEIARQLERLASPSAAPFPAVVGLVGENGPAARLAADAALRGSAVVVCGDGAGVFAGIAAALARGFVTPLEAAQARARVTTSPTFAGFERAGLVFVAADAPAEELTAVLRPRCVVVSCGRPSSTLAPASLVGKGAGGLGSAPLPAPRVAA